MSDPEFQTNCDGCGRTIYTEESIACHKCAFEFCPTCYNEHICPADGD